MIRVQIKNVENVENFLISLPKKLDKNLASGNLNFMKSVQMDAKMMAPVDTGSLKEQIELKPVKRGKNIKKWKIISNAPYSLFQEEGFTPHTFFAGGNFNSSKLPGGRYYMVSKWTPFMKPAINANMAKFNQNINNAIKKSTK